MFGQCTTISRPTIFPPVVTQTARNATKKPSIISNIKKERLSNPSKDGISITPNNMPTIGTSTYSTAAMVSGVAFETGRSITLANNISSQTRLYVDTLASEQLHLNQRNTAFLERVYSVNTNPTTRDVRNYGDWGAVKRLTIRSELMKLQLGGRTDLPLTDSQLSDLSKRIKGIDLSNMSDTQINNIIDGILHPNERTFLNALKVFKATGKVDSCIQASKVDQLRDYLKTVDLDRLTGDEFKKLVDNHMEKTEVHHRTSVGADPTQQSNIDNMETYNTTQHDAAHTDPETGKIDYRRKTYEPLRNRIKEVESEGKRGIAKKNLVGLGAAVAIGFGTGFAIGFIVTLAQNGINPNSMKYAFVAGAKQGATSGVMAAGGFAIGKTVGAMLSKSLTESIKSWVGTNASEETLKKISEMCDMGAVGAIVTVAFAVYEFCKLKHAGYSTKESLLRAGKSAALSFSILIISMVAVWAGAPGLAVSIVAGVIMTGYSVIKIYHNKHVMKDVTLFSIELCRPAFSMA